MRIDFADTNPPIGPTMTGFVSPNGIPNSLEIMREAGVEGGLIRRPFPVWKNDGGAATVVRNAKREGYAVLLTAYGTPQSMATTGTGTVFGGYSIPPYARTVPQDAGAWGAHVVQRIQDIEARTGYLPDYVEIGNEPDRAEWWDGTLEDYLELYAAAASAIKAAYPGIKVGGMGLAGHFSTMDGSESALLALVRRADRDSLPLDFLSWHHYTAANDLALSGIVGEIDGLAASLGMPPVETIVSEWNIIETPGVHGDGVDGPVAAAHLAGFLTTAQEVGLDRSAFFMLTDVFEGGNPVNDLLGTHLGALTLHGVKKPVTRVMELILEMMNEESYTVHHDVDEFSVRVLAGHKGNRVRIVVSNDEITSKWFWVQRCRAAGFSQGQLFEAYTQAAQQIGVNQPSREQLIATGLLSETEAAFCVEVVPQTFAISAREGEDREVIMDLENIDPNWQLVRTVVFNDVYNNPQELRELVETEFSNAEDQAHHLTFDELGAWFTGRIGRTVTGEEIEFAGGLEDWMEANGVPNGQRELARIIRRESLLNFRLEAAQTLNGLTEMRTRMQSFQEANVTRQGNTLRVLMAPDSVTVLEFRL